MNAPTFDSQSVNCPICNRTGTIKQGKILNGLFTCPYCQARLVVTWSGHYVRDPFSLKQVALGKMLRRQSHPMARLWRDLGIVKHPSIIAVFAGAMFLGFAFVGIESYSGDRSPIEKVIEQINEFVDTNILH